MALDDVRRAYFHAPARRRVFVELHPEDYQAGDEHMCGLLQYSLYGTRDAAQNWEEELASTLSDLKLTRGIACPCVWQGCIKGKIFVATVYGTAPRYVREILEDLELERADHSATPCVVERKNEDNARSDESKEKNRCGQGQTQTKHEWDGTSDGDDRDRSQMAGDDSNDSQALTGGDITVYKALAARISYLSQDRPDLKSAQCKSVVRCQVHLFVTCSACSAATET